MLMINGEPIEAADTEGMTLAAYLDKNEYNIHRIAVEHNDRIIPKAEYDEVVLKDGDVIEIVQFMGGGA